MSDTSAEAGRGTKRRQAFADLMAQALVVPDRKRRPVFSKKGNS